MLVSVPFSLFYPSLHVSCYHYDLYFYDDDVVKIVQKNEELTEELLPDDRTPAEIRQSLISEVTKRSLYDRARSARLNDLADVLSRFGTETSGIEEGASDEKLLRLNQLLRTLRDRYRDLEAGIITEQEGFEQRRSKLENEVCILRLVSVFSSFFLTISSSFFFVVYIFFFVNDLMISYS